jgi:hypothetical protein
MKSNEIQAVNDLKKFFQGRKALPKDVMDNMDIVFNTVEQLDQEVKQKTFEVLNREQLLAQKDQLLVQKNGVINQKATELQTTRAELVKKDLLLAEKEQEIRLKTIEAKDPTFVNELVKKEFIDSLHKLYPDSYPARFEDWPNTLPMWKHVANNDYATMIKNTKIYKKELAEKEHKEIPKEFISSLHKLYPDSYPANFKDWTDALPMKKHVIENNIPVMKYNTKLYKQWYAEKQVKELEEAKKFKETEEIRKDKLLIDSQQEIAELKILLAQKEEALHDKSFIKNEIIEELKEEVLELNTLNKELSQVNLGFQIGGHEEASQTHELDLIGDDVDNVLFH